MKIIHIGPDSQFIQFLSRKFEELAPGKNYYLVTSHSAAGGFRYPNFGEGKTISVQGKRGLASIPLHVRSCDMVIAHGMGPHAVVAFIASPRTAIRVWSGWGYDYYGDDSDPSAGLLKPETAALTRTNTAKKNTTSQLKNLARKLISFGVKLTARQTDYFSAPISSDFEIFKRRFDGFSGEYAQLNYGNVPDTFSQGPAMCHGQNILLGNSASETNNHVEILGILSRHDLGSRKVIVPLSYGDHEYRSNIIEIGKRMLGNAFVPLVDYMPLHEYSSIVASCNVVIMNHLRQQALGNIGTALYQGAHVFLDPSNPVYQFFIEKKAIVQSTQNLLSGALPLAGLHADDILRNRSVLESFWGQEQVHANVAALLSKVCDR